MSPRGENRGATGARRKRRTPEAAEREIVEAAEAFLSERPFRELTVDDLMRRTGLSRPSFYVYFKDRHELMLRLTERIGGELFEMSELWYEGTGDGPALVREAVEGVVSVFAQHGPVLRALADAATEDRRVEDVYRGMLDRFVTATARHIDREIGAGRMESLRADETAAALTWMIERYLQLNLGRPEESSVDEVSDVLATILSRALYGVDRAEV